MVYLTVLISIAKFNVQKHLRFAAHHKPNSFTILLGRFNSQSSSREMAVKININILTKRHFFIKNYLNQILIFRFKFLIYLYVYQARVFFFSK